MTQPSAQYIAALDIQDACNLSGVSHHLSRLCTELVNSGQDTMQIRQNAAVILIVAKMADLCGIDCSWHKEPIKQAHDRCLAAKQS